MADSPKNKILSSLRCAKMLGAGQSLKVLAHMAFGDCCSENIKKTRKILYKMSREYRVRYFRETKVWYLLEDD